MCHMYMTDFAYDGPIFVVPLSLSYPSSPLVLGGAICVVDSLYAVVYISTLYVHYQEQTMGCDPTSAYIHTNNILFCILYVQFLFMFQFLFSVCSFSSISYMYEFCKCKLQQINVLTYLLTMRWMKE